ncbi:MAG: serine/threonine protein kinase [Casimicrobiaceae bacterium]|nr:serine/threonine protein kinase [Casimicrobiaceae bacterium]MCX8099316.1 serine/threonine protein kinase [Casimicrobiaceae bacterium]
MSANDCPSPLELTRETWQQVSRLFDEVIELPEGERIPFIRRLWANQPDVARELAAMLVAAAEMPPSRSGERLPFDRILAAALEEAPSGRTRGSRVGAWTLEECLGRGGMGEVWRAHRTDGLYRARAAIKFLRTDASNPQALAARFARERTVLARLNHPNIARLLDAGVHDGNAYLVLELVEGQPLLDYLRSENPPLRRRIEVLREIALAVEHAHQQLVLHRDLKPSNVLVQKDGRIKLLDFGVAGFIQSPEEEPHTKLTELTGRALTIEYASPEQIAGQTTTPASDVYSLGVLAFQLVTGNRPFAELPSRAALEYALLNQDPPLASQHIATTEEARKIIDFVPPPVDAHRVRGDLERIIQRAMQREPEHRYPTVALLLADLDAWLERRPTSFRQHDRLHRLRLWVERHAAVSAIAVTSLLLTVAVIAWLVLSWQSERRALEAERRASEALARALNEIRHSGTTSAEVAHARALERLREALAHDEAARRRVEALTAP